MHQSRGPAAAGSQPERRGGHKLSDLVETIGAAEQCVGWLPVAHDGFEVAVIDGHVWRVRDGNRQLPAQVLRKRVEPLPLSQSRVGSGPTDAHSVCPGYVEGIR
jgi:hypothetical protein